MVQKTKKSLLSEVSTQELQHLITVSSGFIDAYVIQCYNKPPMLLPQNIVLSAFDSPTNLDKVEWHESKLPVYRLNDPSSALGVALIIEGEEIDQRFALMCNDMPKSIRVRISEVVDDAKNIDDSLIMQYVRIENELYHVPHVANIQKEVGIELKAEQV
ncbi:hypothetical protein [Acinetobacter shaoyimingii]|uniref:Uncharacterized protein n=1 Tax=Acinetobacter shaoyimingii TaxID=2715164 RepID=A0A6G8RXK0_9GAMM|nr:hypothetical protein [Acinetobacter shaoyimingii]NHB57624.1 hypothetical protein [Acinetobacter shaoyimingii]QIO06672.1 hypothetical protein G8E00_12335 [Acinetobacter shaoyimingii]